MRFTLCARRRRIEFKIPCQGGRRTYIGRGESGRDLFTQQREAAVRASASEQGNRRPGIPWPPPEETSREPSRIGAKLLALTGALDRKIYAV